MHESGAHAAPTALRRDGDRVEPASMAVVPRHRRAEDGVRVCRDEEQAVIRHELGVEHLRRRVVGGDRRETPAPHSAITPVRSSVVVSAGPDVHTTRASNLMEGTAWVRLPGVMRLHLNLGSGLRSFPASLRGEYVPAMGHRTIVLPGSDHMGGRSGSYSSRPAFWSPVPRDGERQVLPIDGSGSPEVRGMRAGRTFPVHTPLPASEWGREGHDALLVPGSGRRLRNDDPWSGLPPRGDRSVPRCE